jgi:hypothetical protein
MKTHNQGQQEKSTGALQLQGRLGFNETAHLLRRRANLSLQETRPGYVQSLTLS